MATIYQIGEDGSRVERCRIDQEPLVVGRSEQAQINIKDEGMSRRHFLIERAGEDYFIKDLNSRNGTWVGGYRVFEEKLRHNDWIMAGHTLFLFADPPSESTEVQNAPFGPHGTVVLTVRPDEPRDHAELAA
ncbi:MAG TPA: FHA domain-containing protein [Candidatus Paceibacterota bacterium]|nr:FHA domain-containing protein [Verrucomicrobiota bacterium]HSA09716.1 FHA domain-containing protein [Candidatus Paceibacterota bacterium]